MTHILRTELPDSTQGTDSKEGHALFQVTISATVSHYYYSALAVHRAGLLNRYICGIATSKQLTWLEPLIPTTIWNKLRSRIYMSLPHNRMKSIWWVESMRLILEKGGLISGETGNLFNNYLHDLSAWCFVRGNGIFHFMSGVGLYSAKKAKRKGAVVVCDVRQEYPDFQFSMLEQESKLMGIEAQASGKSYDRKIKMEFAIADYFIVPSDYAKKTFIQYGVYSDKIFVLPYGVSGLTVSGHSGINNNPSSYGKTFRLIYAGQIVLRKGIQYLIDGFNRLEVEDAELLLIGRIDKGMKGIIDKAMAENQKIRTIGHLEKSELYKYFHASSVFVLPTLADSWGLVVLEAMSCGLPVIITEHTGAKEAVSDGIDGFVVPIRDPTAITDRLRFLHDNVEERRRMGEAARKTANKYTWDAYGDNLVKIYSEIMRRKEGMLEACK